MMRQFDQHIDANSGIRRTVRSLLLVLAIAVTMFLHPNSAPGQSGKKSVQSRPAAIDPTDFAAIRNAGNAIRPLHSKMGKLGPGDWLAHHKESGQTFDEYLRDHKKRVRDQFQTIYVQPLGEFEGTHAKLLEQTVDFMASMNGSKSLPESDSRPLEFCPECQEKIWWTCGLEPKARYRQLLEFAVQHGLDDEAAYWQKALERLQ